MIAISHTTSVSPTKRKVGYTLSTIAVLFLVVDTVIKLVEFGPAVESTTRLGYPSSSVLVIGILEAVCLILYLVRRTSVLGAVVFTGFLGGAFATHFRHGDPLFSHILFPVYIAALLWGGLYLREERLHALVPVRR